MLCRLSWGSPPGRMLVPGVLTLSPSLKCYLAFPCDRNHQGVSWPQRALTRVDLPPLWRPNCALPVATCPHTAEHQVIQNETRWP